MMRKSRTYNLLQVWSMLFLVALTGWGPLPGAKVLAQNFTLSDGDLVHCIPIKAQPSLVGVADPTYHKLPSTKLTSASTTAFPSKDAKVGVQTFAMEVGECPDGTIPVKTNASGIIPGLRQMKKRKAPQDFSEATVPHEYAIGFADTDSHYKGTEVVMSIWDPYVENDQEFSLGQLWLYRGEPLNTVEVGYQVYESLRGDNLSRLFIFWTADGYQDTGCYDLGCPGFVQVSNKVLIRGAFAPVSTPDGQRYEIKLRVFQDDATHDWWLQLNGEYVGYWPRDLYTSDGLRDAATGLEWGGEVVNDQARHGHRHTKTHMGSGYEDIEKSAYMRNLKYVNANDELVDAPIDVFNTSAPCYKATLGDSSKVPEWGSFFYFGGPGYNSMCLTHPDKPS